MHHRYFTEEELLNVWRISQLRQRPTNPNLRCHRCDQLLEFAEETPIELKQDQINLTLNCTPCGLFYSDSLQRQPGTLRHQVWHQPARTEKSKDLSDLPSEPFNSKGVDRLQRAETDYMAPRDWFLWARHIYHEEPTLHPKVLAAARSAIDLLSENVAILRLETNLLKILSGMQQIEHCEKWVYPAALYLLPKGGLKLMGSDIRFISFAWRPMGARRYRTLAGSYANRTNQLIVWFGNPAQKHFWHLVRNEGGSLAEMTPHTATGGYDNHLSSAYRKVIRLILHTNQFMVDNNRRSSQTRHPGDVPKPTTLALFQDPPLPAPKLHRTRSIPWQEQLKNVTVLEDDHLYSATQAAEAIWNSSPPGTPSHDRASWLPNATRALKRLARTYDFPTRGDGTVKDARNRKATAWYGFRWKTCIC